MSRDKYEAINRKWGDFDCIYYDILNAIDRLKELLEDKYGSLYKASITMGLHKTYLPKILGDCYMFPRIPLLYRICKELGVSMHYVVMGYGDRTFTDSTLSFNNFLNTYDTLYKGEKHMSLNTSVCRFKQGLQKTLPLKYLIKVARRHRVTIDWLTGG